MRAILAGSRSITKYGTLLSALADCPFSSKITEVVSGAAQGVDQLGERWAREQGIPVRRFPAEWEKYGRGAGYERNLEMGLYGDALVAVWDGKSRGTEHMVKMMLGTGKRVYVWRVDKGRGAVVRSLVDLSDEEVTLPSFMTKPVRLCSVVNIRQTPKPYFDICIMRPSVYGNPFSHLLKSQAKWRVATREDAIAEYARWLMEEEQAGLRERALRELPGKVMGCCCLPLACHGQVLARFVNRYLALEPNE